MTKFSFKNIFIGLSIYAGLSLLAKKSDEKTQKKALKKPKKPIKLKV